MTNEEESSDISSEQIDYNRDSSGIQSISAHGSEKTDETGGLYGTENRKSG